MKALSAGVLLVNIILTIPSAPAQTKWFLNTEHLNGPVHTVQIELSELYMVENKEVESARRPHQRVVYDRNGNEIERINFNRDGSIENRNVQIIDANGRIAGWEDYEPEAGGKRQHLTNRSEWIYDKRGNRSETRVYTQGNLSSRTIATYDTAGHLVTETMITDNDTYKVTKRFTYDSGGRLTKTVADTNGAIELIEQSYDASGNLAGYKYFGPGGQNVSEVRYAYDAFGSETERNAEDSISKYKMITSYDSRGRVSTRTTYFEYKQPHVSISHAAEPGTVQFRYNDNDQVVEEGAYSPEGKLLRSTIRDYDKAARLRSEVYRNNDDVMVGKVNYEYDKWGNLVKKVSVDRDQFGRPAVHIEHRVLTYYEGKR